MVRAKKAPKGAALVEYGILTGLIAVLSISAVVRLGTAISNGFTSVDEALVTAQNSVGVIPSEDEASEEPGAMLMLRDSYQGVGMEIQGGYFVIEGVETTSMPASGEEVVVEIWLPTPRGGVCSFNTAVLTSFYPFGSIRMGLKWTADGHYTMTGGATTLTNGTTTVLPPHTGWVPTGGSTLIPHPAGCPV